MVASNKCQCYGVVLDQVGSARLAANFPRIKAEFDLNCPRNYIYDVCQLKL